MLAPPSAHGSGLAYSLDLLTVEETELRWEAGHPQTCGPPMALRAHERPYMRSCLEVPFRLVCAQHNLLRIPVGGIQGYGDTSGFPVTLHDNLRHSGAL